MLASARELSAPIRSANAAFPRSARLTRPAEFQRVFGGAKRLGDKYFTVLVAANGLSHPRLGLAVPKRAVRSAVARNRFKRLVRESFRAAQHGLGAWDIVVVAKPGAGDAPGTSLREALQRSWRRIPK